MLDAKEKTEGIEERSVSEGSRWLDNITDLKNMNLRKFWEIVEDKRSYITRCMKSKVRQNLVLEQQQEVTR